MQTLTITPVTGDRPVCFAARELVRYLQQMGNAAALCERGGSLVLGTYGALGLDKPEHDLDDGYLVRVDGAGRGMIAGANPRSVLMGAYRYLAHCGCRFLYPGSGGEVVPQAPYAACRLEDAPSYRHRCVSIEGANAPENVLAMIDWLPKAGMNSYHLQLEDGYTFFERWYGHHHNPLKEGRPVTPEQTRAYLAQARDALQQRGLLLQYMGHGWTNEPFGIHALGWEPQHLDLPAGTAALLAQVKGRRGLWKGIPVDTNACYSNPLARRKMVDYIAGFCGANPDAAFVHVWLADDVNNHCECPACRQKRPADWYVALLNELDAALTARGLGTRIVFLVYCETLWPPLESRIEHPGRFAMIFAPVSLNYTAPFLADGPLPPLQPFVLNDIRQPVTAAENLAYLKSWEPYFSGDRFIYLYHLLSCGWEKDLTGQRLARLLHQDIAHLADAGLNGASACQAQRACFPTGLCMYVQARTLWDKGVSFAQLEREYFTAAFGAGWQAARDMLEEVAACVTPAWLQHETDRTAPQWERRFSELAPRLRLAQAACRAGAEGHAGAEGRNWRYLEVFFTLISALMPLLLADARGDRRAAKAAWETFLPQLFSYEDELQSVFDMEWFCRNFALFQVRGLKHFVNHAEEED